MNPSDELARLLPPAPARQELPRRQRHRAELLTIIAADRRRAPGWPTATARRWLWPALAAVAVAAVAVLAVAVPALTADSGAGHHPATHRPAPARPPGSSRLTSARHWSVPAASFRAIAVSVDRGSVQVHGGDTASATIGATPRYLGQAPVITSTVAAGTLTVTVHCPREPTCQALLTLTVPAGVPVHATSDVGDVRMTGLRADVTARSRQGNVVLTHLSGLISATNDLGDVDLTDISGPVTARTSDGDITATGLTAAQATLISRLGDVSADFVTAPETVTATSQLGDVTVQLPSTATYDVTANTGLGSASVTAPQSARSPRVIHASSQLGSVTVSGG